jgi:hypothetical protein
MLVIPVKTGIQQIFILHGALVGHGGLDSNGFFSNLIAKRRFRGLSEGAFVYLNPCPVKPYQ